MTHNDGFIPPSVSFQSALHLAGSVSTLLSYNHYNGIQRGIRLQQHHWEQNIVNWGNAYFIKHVQIFYSRHQKVHDI